MIVILTIKAVDKEKIIEQNKCVASKMAGEKI